MRLSIITVSLTSALISLSRCALNTDVSLADGIAPGGKQIFVIESTFGFPGGNLGGTAGADNMCQNDSYKPGRGTYKALIVSSTRRACVTSNCSTSNEGIDWVLTANTKYVQKDSIKEVFTTNANGIFIFGTMTNKFTTFASSQYYTGLTGTWQTSANTCNNWTSSSGGVNGQVGDGSFTTTAAISSTTVPCSGTQRLVCVEQ
jgi:hypothetical protein